MTQTQPTLWPGEQKRPTIDDRFQRFLLECPDVYPEFVRLALELKRGGHQHYGADAICQVIRFHRSVSGPAQDGFKVNDHFVSRLSRKAMAENAELQGFFETRELRAK